MKQCMWLSIKVRITTQLHKKKKFLNKQLENTNVRCGSLAAYHYLYLNVCFQYKAVIHKFTQFGGDTDVGKGSSIYFVHIVFLNDFEFPHKA